MGNNVDGNNLVSPTVGGKPIYNFDNLQSGLSNMQTAWDNRVQGMKDRATSQNLARKFGMPDPTRSSVQLPEPSYAQQRSTHRQQRNDLNRQIAMAGARKDWDQQRALQSRLAGMGTTNEVFPLFQGTQNIAGIGEMPYYSAYNPATIRQRMSINQPRTGMQFGGTGWNRPGWASRGHGGINMSALAQALRGYFGG